jgi:hypothetical protein
MTVPTGSAIIAALEAAWDAVQERVEDLPDVVFISGTGVVGRGAKWGHYRGHGWAVRSECPEGCDEHAHEDGGLVRYHGDGRKPEVFIAGERLAAGADLTLQTLLHEGAHALNAARGESGTSKEGRYHNKTFLAAAEEMGLRFEGQPDATIGYSSVVLTDEARKTYTDVIEALDEAIAVYMDTFAGLRTQGGQEGGAAPVPGAGAPKAKSRNNPKAMCGCEEPRILRASKKVLAEGPILCGLCREEFVVQDDED